MTTYYDQPQTTLPPPLQGGESPVYLGESHELNLSAPELFQHAKILEEALADPSVQGALNEFGRQGDTATYLHCLRVASLVVAATVRLGMPYRDILVGAKGAVTHDVGKSLPSIYRAIKSPATFTEQPRLFSIVREHPAAGVALAKQYGLDANVQKMIGLHHTLQTDRMPYGTGDTLQGVPEADGFTPNLAWLVGALAVADGLDALTIDAKSGRPYLKGKMAGQAEVQRNIATLRTNNDVKTALLDVAGYSKSLV